ATDARIERQASELTSDRGELVGVIHCAQLGEQRVAIGDSTRNRRIEEGKIRDLAELEALRAQDHRGERRAQELRIGEGRSLVVILLGVETDADAVRQTAAATGALARRRLRDRFDAQELHLLPIAV